MKLSNENDFQEVHVSLKPCPVCGSRNLETIPDHNNYFIIECKECHAIVDVFYSRDMSKKISIGSVLTIGSETKYLTQRIQIHFSKKLSEICKLSKKLRNSAVFIGRQVYFLITRESYPKNAPIVQIYPEFTKQLLKFIENKIDSPSMFEELKIKLLINPSSQISNEIKKKLMLLWKRTSLYEWLKFESVFINLGKVYSQLPTQILEKVHESWSLYFESIKKWKENSWHFPGGKKPNIPHYGRKFNQFLISFSGHHFIDLKGTKEHYENTKRITEIRHRKTKKIVKSYTTAELMLPRKFLNFFPEKSPFPKIRTTINLEKIKEVRIVPKGSHFMFEIVYLMKKQSKLNPINVASIDMGLNNLMVITTNNFFNGRKIPPVIIRGRYVKWANQLMNKLIASMQNERTKGGVKAGEETMEMKRIRNNRENRIRSYFHATSNFLIEFCKFFKIGTILIGHNDYWKSEINFGKKSTQNFVFVPFNWLINQIKYKAEMAGIQVNIGPEGYTSKASAIDRDTIPNYDPNNSNICLFSGERGPFMQGKKSKRKIEEEKRYGQAYINDYKIYHPRGLYKTKTGHYIHSDVNGSYNIGRLLCPNIFDKLSVNNMLISPVSINVLKYGVQNELYKYINRLKSGPIAYA